MREMKLTLDMSVIRVFSPVSTVTAQDAEINHPRLFATMPLG
jgi:hypothetical protein